MDVCETVAELRAVRGAWAGRVALVPTMGALHRGHLALVARARELAPHVVASVFVNPTQFGDPRDLAAYPRDLDADAAMLEAAGVDALFAPDAEEMYPPGHETVVETTRLARVMHGEVRPGHFRGVATVVCKLINAARPDAALFGQKDYQQLAVIRRMARDLLLPVEVVGVPTVRDADGVALSSRNARLSPEDRAAAVVLNRALEHGEWLLRNGYGAETVAGAIVAEVNGERRAKGARADIVDAETFEPARGPLARAMGIMASARFGDVLLIDQREVTP